MGGPTLRAGPRPDVQTRAGLSGQTPGRSSRQPQPGGFHWGTGVLVVLGAGFLLVLAVFGARGPPSAPSLPVVGCRPFSVLRHLYLCAMTVLSPRKRKLRSVWDSRVDQWADTVDESPAFAQLRERMLQLAAPVDSDRCLDLGAGTGCRPSSVLRHLYL